jgi:hypothetical protein
MSSTKGFTEFKISCNVFSNGLLDVIMKALEKVAADSSRQIKQDAPVDTGFMRDEVKVDKPGNNSVRIKANAYYSIFVDKGHRTRSGSHVPANPFFSTEVDKMKAGKVKAQVDADVAAFIKNTF